MELLSDSTENSLIDIPNVTYKELLIEYENCQILWGSFSCECFSFYIIALHKEIVKQGGWPIKN